MRDNPLSAENQQERLIQIGWIVGFVDGEGCFSINLVRQAGSGTRNGYKTGYQIGHSFAVVQGARSIETLQALRAFFGVGTLCVNRRRDSHKEDLYRYCVTRRDDLTRVIIPFFREHQLRTAKRLKAASGKEARTTSTSIPRRTRRRSRSPSAATSTRPRTSSSARSIRESCSPQRRIPGRA